MYPSTDVIPRLHCEKMQLVVTVNLAVQRFGIDMAQDFHLE